MSYSAIYRGASAINEAMGRVYFYMMTAVLNSFAVSYLVSSNKALMAFLFGPIVSWIVILAPVALAFIIPSLIERASKATALAWMHVFAAVMGLSMSAVFAVYTGLSIFSAFIGAAVLFGVMSAYGYFTKTNLDTVGKYAFVALIAIIIVSIINLFIGSSVLQMVISAIAILVFLALTAYDTQTIREMVSVDDNGNAEVLGAVTLYLDFINIFVNLLQLFGSKED
jgi:FtsH-binding integral membrane protein